MNDEAAVEIGGRLAAHAERIRVEGPDVAPLILTDGDAPYAALLPYGKLVELVDAVEDAAILATLLERTATDTGKRVTLAEAAEAFGINLDDL